MRVVVEFDDDGDAKEFVRLALEEAGVKGDMNSEYWTDGVKILGAIISAVYKKPSKFCTPDDGHLKGKGSRSFTRGRKYGWWVCAVCGKPTKKWARGDIWHFSMGYNLLPPSVSDLDRGVRSTVEWTEEDLGIVHPEVVSVPECKHGAYYIGDDKISRCTDCEEPYNG